jgi:hypothetical protein
MRRLNHRLGRSECSQSPSLVESCIADRSSHLVLGRGEPATTELLGCVFYFVFSISASSLPVGKAASNRFLYIPFGPGCSLSGWHWVIKESLLIRSLLAVGEVSLRRGSGG